MDASTRNLGAVHRVAYAIGRVIAKKTMAEDPILARMDGLGQASAVHTMAVRMTNELLEEAAAAYAESLKIRREDEAAVASEAVADG